jgi:DNA-binding transcriptional LysR family regulator
MQTRSSKAHRARSGFVYSPPAIPEVAYRQEDERVGVELSLLPTFMTLVDLESFSKTAYAHGLSRNAVLKRIRLLEQLTGERLYRVRGKKVELTENGRTFSQYANEVMAMRVRRRCRGSETIVVAATAEIVASLLTPSLERFVTDDRARIEVVTGTEEAMIEEVLAKRAHLAVVSRAVEGVVSHRITQVRPVVAARAGHAAVQRNVTTLEALRNERVFAIGELAAHVVDCEVVESTEVALALAAANVGVAVVDGFHRDRGLLRVASICDVQPKVLRIIRAHLLGPVPARTFETMVTEDLRRRFGKQKPKIKCLAGS